MKKKLFIVISLTILLISSLVSYFVFVYKSPEQIQQEKYWSDVNRDVEKVNKNLKEKGITLTTLRDELLTLKYDMNSFRETDNIHHSSWKNYLYKSNEVMCKDFRALDIFFSSYSNSSDCEKAITATVNTIGDNNESLYLTLIEFEDVSKTKDYLEYARNTPKQDYGQDTKNRLLMTRKLSKYIFIMDPYSSSENCDFDNYTCPYQKFTSGDEQTNQNRVYIYDVFSRLDLV